MDIIVWFEKEGGEVIASAVTPKGVETLTGLLYSFSPVYVIAMRDTPDSFLENVKDDTITMIYQDGEFTPLTADKKVLQ